MNKHCLLAILLAVMLTICCLHVLAEGQSATDDGGLVNLGPGEAAEKKEPSASIEPVQSPSIQSQEGPVENPIESADIPQSTNPVAEDQPLTQPEMQPLGEDIAQQPSQIPKELNQANIDAANQTNMGSARQTEDNVMDSDIQSVPSVLDSIWLYVLIAVLWLVLLFGAIAIVYIRIRRD